MYKRRKKEEAITLITLVVTIIVLLIIAGISMNLAIGQDGIIINAEKAKENYTNAAIYENELLSEILQQKIEDLDNPENVSRLYLYYKGNEYEEITGGWQVGFLAGTDATVGKAEKKEEYVEVETWGYWCGCGMESKKAISVTPYSKLKVEIIDCTWEDISGYEQVALTCQGINQIVYRENISSGSGIYEMDISNITGLSIIGIQLGNGTRGKIRSVWLEE